MQRRLKMAMKRTKNRSKGGVVRRMGGGGAKMTKYKAKKGRRLANSKNTKYKAKMGRRLANSKKTKYRSRGGRAK